MCERIPSRFAGAKHECACCWLQNEALKAGLQGATERVADLSGDVSHGHDFLVCARRHVLASALPTASKSHCHYRLVVLTPKPVTAVQRQQGTPSV